MQHRSKDSLSSFAHWELKKELGAGGFGEVLLWKHSLTNQEIATKRLKENNNLSCDEVSKLKHRWLQEVQWMADLNLPYIVRGIVLNDNAFLAYLNEHHTWHPLPVIVMEYCNSGDLRTHLQKLENLNGLHEFEVRQILHALRHAIEYLHEKCHIQHRDLKPDNIVIHQVGNQRNYKLTDFGFARIIADQTIIQSVVGTLHYFAPEVISSGKYNNTVDYWSIGVIAYELICGSLPFIPHQTLINIVENIKKKPAECIAITENPDEVKSFCFEEHISSQQRMSSVFVQKIVKWLRMALDANYKIRGSVVDHSMSRKLTFFTEFDAIYESKVLTIFCLNDFKFYSYEIHMNLSMTELIEAMANDTGIPREQFYFVLPTNHPAREFNATTKPIDLYAEEWQDTTDRLSPPVMLFLLGYQCNYSALDSPNISSLMRKCMQLKGDEQQATEWLIQQFEKETNFLLSNEQRHLAAFLIGLKEYALTVENDIFLYELEPLHTEALLVQGGVKHYKTMVITAAKAYEKKMPNCGAFFETWSNKANLFDTKINMLNIETIRHLQTRYKSALRRAKEQANNKIFDELILHDIYGVSDFQQSLKSARKNLKRSNRLELCQSAIINCLQKRKAFFDNKQLDMAKDTITAVHKEFCEIQKIVPNVQNYLIEFGNQLEIATYDFQAQLLENILSKPIKSEQQEKELNSYKTDFSCKAEINGMNSINTFPKSIWNVSTNALIEDAMQNLKLMEQECSEADSDLPTTIEY